MEAVRRCPQTKYSKTACGGSFVVSASLRFSSKGLSYSYSTCLGICLVASKNDNFTSFTKRTWNCHMTKAFSESCADSETLCSHACVSGTCCVFADHLQPKMRLQPHLGHRQLGQNTGFLAAFAIRPTLRSTCYYMGYWKKHVSFAIPRSHAIVFLTVIVFSGVGFFAHRNG